MKEPKGVSQGQMHKIIMIARDGREFVWEFTEDRENSPQGLIIMMTPEVIEEDKTKVGVISARHILNPFAAAEMAELALSSVPEPLRSAVCRKVLMSGMGEDNPIQKLVSGLAKQLGLDVGEAKEEEENHGFPEFDPFKKTKH